MRKFLEIAHTGLVALLLHPLRSLATMACLVAVLLPYLVGLAISYGVQREAEASIDSGADLYVTGIQFGRNVPVPLYAVEKIKNIDGVRAVIPRIVGEMVLGKESEHAVVVGLPSEAFPASITCVEGSLTSGSKMNELVMGSELARRLGLKLGDLIPPFYRNDRGEHISKVVGIFRSDVSLWQSHLIFTSFDTASAIFDQQGLATDLLVYCLPEYQTSVAAAILRTVSISPSGGDGNVRLRVTTRKDLQALLPQGLLHREGIFNLHFVLAFAVGILTILVTSGFGLAERRREIGILKATGWQTDEILLRSLVESLLLSLTGASLSLLLAYTWLQAFNGYGIAGIFLAGADPAPGFRVPFRLAPVPALLAFVISLVMIMSGTLYSTWRAATVAPREALR